MAQGKTVLQNVNELRIFYSTVEKFPPLRLDVVELFMRELAARGVITTWYMKRREPGGCAKSTSYGQKVLLPWFGATGRLGNLFNKITYWACDVIALLSVKRGEFSVIQVRDKYFAAIAGWLTARFVDAKFIYWLSYPFPEHDLEMAKVTRGPKKLYLLVRGRISYFWLYKLVFFLSDHVFVQSEQMLRDVARYGVPVSKMTPVPMGVPPHLLDWVATHAGEGVQVGKVVYVGTLARVRRMGEIIEAFRLVRQRNARAHLFMVGAGDTPAERTELETLAQRLGLADVVTFTGFLPMEEAWRHAASAEVCVSPIYPSPVLNAGSPTKLVEYMALGRPVVANDHPEQATILAESGAGLCVPWGVESFADAICELLDNPDKAQAMGARGPAWVAANRTYDKLAAQVHARYLALLGGEA